MNLENILKKRGAAGALFFDEKGRVLLIEPTYKSNWEIPGGMIEDNESPKEACEREVLEELGLKINIGKLLCLEYQREEDDSYMFVFDGGVLDELSLNEIKIQENEVKSYDFYSLDEVKDRVLEKMFIRIQQSCEAREEKRTKYYETTRNACLRSVRYGGNDEG